MARAPEIFSVAIGPALPAHPGGRIVCTTPAPRVYLLTFTSPPDNRLTPQFCRALMTCLDIIEFGYEPGVVVTTSGIQKFYSSGLDLDIALAKPEYWGKSLYPLYRRLLTYPMPTVAMLNGHAFAGGIILAMHHDYRVLTGGRGLACVVELDLGLPLPPAMTSIFRIKTTPSVFRTLVLEAKRYDGRAALEAEVVDAVGELDVVLKLIEDRKLVEKGSKASYGWLKTEMYRESVALLDADNPAPPAPKDRLKVEETRKADGRAWLEEWKTGRGKRADGRSWLEQWKEGQEKKAKL